MKPLLSTLAVVTVAALSCAAFAGGPTKQPTPKITTKRGSSAAASAAQKSSYTIGGVSLSEVSAKQMQAALKKAGYGLLGPTDPTVCGTVEQFQLTLTRQGKPLGVLNLQRSASAPKAGCVPTAISKSLEIWRKAAAGPKSTSAMLYDKQADVLCAVNIFKHKGAAEDLLKTLVGRR